MGRHGQRFDGTERRDRTSSVDGSSLPPNGMSGGLGADIG